MGRFYVIKDLKHVCIGKEGPIKNIEDHKPLLFFPDELKKFHVALLEAMKEENFQFEMERKIGPLSIVKEKDKWEIKGNRGVYKATTPEIKNLLSELIRPEIKVVRRNQNPKTMVCAAPHGGFDLYSDTIARFLAKSLKMGCVIAKHFRYPPEYEKPEIIPLYINVNRPTEGQYLDGSLKKEIVTSRSGEVYYEYQKKILRAANAKKTPIDFLIEIHAHNRNEHVEVATVGWTVAEVVQIKNIWKTLFSDFPMHDVDQLLKIEPIDEIFWKASMAKKFGAFRKEMVSRGLHIEFPHSILHKKYLPLLKKYIYNWISNVLSEI